MNKKIYWKSWNALADDYLNALEAEIQQMEEDLASMQGENQEMMPIPMSLMRGEVSQVIYTPLGAYPIDSMFKPSDRWDCRIGTTNFTITHGIKNKLMEIEGVEALKVLGRYTFFVGIPPTFDFKDVRRDIENELCVFTEEEIMTEEAKATVELVKEQIIDKKYWSILVASTGKVDYIVSDKLDQRYMDGLNELVEIKQLLGGIILRGEDG